MREDPISRHSVSVSSPGPSTEARPSAPAGHDYYDRSWGALVEGQHVDASDELWARQLPIMRVFAYAVIAVTLVSGYPREDSSPLRGPAFVALLAAVAVVFWFMWVRKAIWQYPTRTLAVHAVFQVLVYAALMTLSPQAALLQLIVYPQVVFSIPIRWSVVGCLLVGSCTGLATLARSPTDPAAALPVLFYNLLIATLVVTLGVWIRQTISQSMERRALIGAITEARAELASAELDAVVAGERTRMAREIHDTLAQGFTSVVALLEAADADLDRHSERAREDIRAAREIARSSLSDARTMVWALRPEAIAAAGLPAAIERVARLGGSTDPAVDATVCGHRRRLHPDVEVTLLRAAQEAVANARRHAAASRISVTLTYFDDEISLDVADDGRGFDPEAAASSGGLGLLGMRERAAALGGSVSIESAPGEGSAIAVTLPALEPPGPATSPVPAPAPTPAAAPTPGAAPTPDTRPGSGSTAR